MPQFYSVSYLLMVWPLFILYLYSKCQWWHNNVDSNHGIVYSALIPSIPVSVSSILRIEILDICNVGYWWYPYVTNTCHDCLYHLGKQFQWILTYVIHFTSVACYHNIRESHDGHYLCLTKEVATFKYLRLLKILVLSVFYKSL